MNFWTDGESYTNLVYSYFKEGNFKGFKDLIKDAPEEYKILFFNGVGKFTGDTRKDGLFLSTREINNWDETILVAIRTLTHSNLDTKSNLKVLKEYVESREVNSLINRVKLEDEGFDVYTFSKAHDTLNLPIHNGVILPNGLIVLCEYQGHKYIYSKLREFGYTEDKWYDINDCISISSTCLNSNALNSGEMTNSQYKTIFNIRKYVKPYTGSRTTINLLYSKYSNISPYGNKYTSIKFLDKFYKVNTPNISIVEKDNYIIRTSLKYPLPGLIDSKFKVDKNSINEINKQWETIKDIKYGNELTIFYQEYIEGDNGVAIFNEKFSYDLSTNQGDIVKGNKGNTNLSKQLEKELSTFTENLSNDFGEPIQLEFVIKDNVIYYLEFKILNNLAVHRPYPKPVNILYTIKSFTQGIVTITNLNEVCIVTKDIDNKEELIGKKCLLVRDQTEFSHALALSSFLNIPSAIISDIELPSKFKLDTNGEEGYIIKL